METPEKILLGLLLGALAAFPIALFLYLRTAYRQEGWAGVKTALAVLGLVALIYAAVVLWGKHMEDLVRRGDRAPFSTNHYSFGRSFMAVAPGGKSEGQRNA